MWHCALRAHPASPPLSDARWEDAVRRVLAATGIAPEDDPVACRWIALRVDGHEARIIAPLARRDGEAPRMDRDLSRAMAACQLLEYEHARGSRRRPGAAVHSTAPRAGIQQVAQARPFVPHAAQPGLRPR
ncbi:hypothetical protein ACFVVU_30655 [Kitasatospora sp. NPDC057965]|uniref:hypothetical protein n=1 Tax=Kitasatospora sp. NPDC057965 TaxID=3346291 RepID=UPI0036DB16DE